MKNFIILVAICLFTASAVFGQINEGQTNMSLGVQNGFETVLEGVTTSEAVKLWTDHMKQFGSVKRNKKANEHYITGIKVNQISLGSGLDLYVRFTERGSNTTMTLWVDSGTAFINSKDHPKEHAGLIAFMEDFRLHAKRFAIQKELTQVEKDLKKMQKEQEGLFKENQKLHEDIRKAEERILKAKEDIKTNLHNQEAKKLEIDKQMELMKSVEKALGKLNKK